jgi:protein-tyrosine kinase
MSRIYEALQKAESERGSETQKRTDSMESVAVADYDIPLATMASLESQSRDAEIYSPYAVSSALDLSSVPLKPWSPDLRQLPALLERGPAVEQFRSLRSRIYELRDIKPLKSILISSGMPQEGKSFVATNLAISLARNKNAKVLLIDGDMRRYTVHQLLGCEAEPGLADYLAGRSTILEVMQRPEAASITATAGIRVGGLSSLTLIAGGNGGDRAADLSNHQRFGELMEAVTSLFDWIIVDSSPVLPVSDAVNLARSCDGVLLVARGGITNYVDAQKAQGELKGANVLGFVLNAAEKPPQVGTYYGYHPRNQGE